MDSQVQSVIINDASQDSAPILQVKHLKKSFGDLHVLKDISFDLNAGEVLSIIGPSGSGKSTLLRCLTQLETFEAGEVRVDGKDMVVPGSCIGGKIKYAPAKTLRDIRDARALARFLLKQMGLEGKEKSYPCELSGGQQQRVSIARALALKPKILFFDEPTSALDPELTGEVLKIIKKLAEDRMTMVIVTHEMAFARDVANKVMFMDQGVVVEQGTPDFVFNQSQNKRLSVFLERFSRT